MDGNTRGSTGSVADSTIFFRNSQGLESRGTLVHLTRTLVVFEVYNPYSLVQLSEVMQELRISRRERVIYSGRAMVANLVSTGLMLIVTAALVDPWSDLNGVVTTEGVREEADRFLEDWRRNHHLRPGFQLATNRLASFCGELSRWLEGTELSMAGAGDRGHSLPRELLEETTDRVGPQLGQLWADFEGEADQVPAEDVNAHKNFAQRELHPVTMVSPWLNRCFTKPFGYAGDYVMLNMLLDDPYAGPNAYAKLVNRSLIETDPPLAYVNRISMLCDRLVAESRRVRREHGRPMRACTIGCGPVNEVQRFMRRHPDDAAGCEFHLLDFNQPTIDFAMQRFEAVRDECQVDIHARCENKSIHDLLREARGRIEGPGQEYDFVYCAGLFDYLSDRVCGSLIRLFHSWVGNGGLVTVTNVAHSNPIQNTLEFLMEWYLIYRDGPCMLRLTPDTGLQSVALDSTGIDVFLDVRKPGRR